MHMHYSFSTGFFLAKHPAKTVYKKRVNEVNDKTVLQLQTKVSKEVTWKQDNLNLIST